MKRVDLIIANSDFRRRLANIEELEADRIFCRHNMDHFLDVARIAVIMAGEAGLDIERDVIYAAAILHDIGRDRQYIDGTRHEIASAEAAPDILKECGFDDEETTLITEAIRQHGNPEAAKRSDLVGIIYRADKASRKCFMCTVRDKCHKPEEKLVMEIDY